MMTEFILPDIGEGIVECELLEWLVSEGERIEEDQPVAEVMTDKATVQIPAMHAGVVKKLHYQPGDIAKVHAPLFAVDVEGDEQAPSKIESTADSVSETVETSTTALTTPTNDRSEDFILPDIGEGIVECEIVKWHIVEGDSVEEDQVVVEVMTDKAVVEIPAKHSGTVTKLYHQQGEIAKVHTPLFALSAEGATLSEQGKTSEELPSTLKDNQTTKNADKPHAKTLVADGREDAFEAPVCIPGKVLASPAVRRIAREQQIDLATIKGSGKKGRVLKADLASVVAQAKNNVNSPATHSFDAIAESKEASSVSTADRTIKLKGVQAAMAKQMVASVSTIPHFTVTDELDMGPLIALRSTLKPAFEKEGVKLSFMPLFIKALSLALNDFPVINSRLNDDATELTYLSDHNIGFAVDSKIGLLVPNIKRVQDLSLLDIAKEMQSLIALARDGKLPSASLKGGSISISNIGVLGGMVATPVINKPEAAIVALGKTQTLPRFDDKGEVIAQSIMNVSWSGDHRIIDGATMVRFNNLWFDYLTNPSLMLMHLK